MCAGGDTLLIGEKAPCRVAGQSIRRRQPSGDVPGEPYEDSDEEYSTTINSMAGWPQPLSSKAR
jgi:hypothetical protein